MRLHGSCMSLLLSSHMRLHGTVNIISQITVIAGFRDHKRSNKKHFLTGCGTGYIIVELMGYSYISMHCVGYCLHANIPVVSAWLLGSHHWTAGSCMSWLLGSHHETAQHAVQTLNIISQITVIAGFRDHKRRNTKHFRTGCGTGCTLLKG